MVGSDQQMLLLEWKCHIHKKQTSNWMLPYHSQMSSLAIGEKGCLVWEEKQNGSVALRELSKMEPGDHWGSVTYAHLGPRWNLTYWPLTVLMKASKTSVRNSRYLLDSYPKITVTACLLIKPLPWNNSWFLKDKYFLTCIRVNHNSHWATLTVVWLFVFISLLTLSP